MVGHKAHRPSAQTPRWWGANLTHTHTFAAVAQQRAAGRLNCLGEESPVSSPTIQLIHSTKALTTNLFLREQGRRVGGLASTGKRGLDQAVFSSWGGCSWWSVVFVLGVDVGVVVGWCVVAFVGGGVGGVLLIHTPIHIQRPHALSTSTIIHYPHTHPKLRVSAGLVDPRGSTSTSNDPPPKNPHRPQSTSKPGRRTGGVGGSTMWIHHPQSTANPQDREMGTNPSLHLLQQRPHPGDENLSCRCTPYVVMHDLPGWWCWVVGEWSGRWGWLKRYLLGGWGEEEPHPKGHYKDNRLEPN